MKLSCCIFLLSPALMLAQAGGWSSPRLGYFFDRDAKAIRVLAGVPGAAGAETTVALGSKLEGAWVSPGRSYAVAAVRDSSEALLIVLAAAPSSSDLKGSIPPTFAGFSPSGSAAVLYNKESGKLQVWSGLPSAPSLARETTVGGMRSASVSDDGKLLAVLDETGVVIGSRDAELQRLASARAAQFLRGSHDLAVAFTESNQVSLVRNPGREASLVTLAGPGDGVSEPLSIALSGSGRHLAVANSAGHSVTVIDLESKKVATLAVEGAAREVSALRGGSVFRVAGDSLSVLDVSDGDGRLTRVPFEGGER